MYFFGLGIAAWTGVRWNPDGVDAEAVDDDDDDLLLLLYAEGVLEEEELDDPEEGSFAPRLLVLWLWLLPLPEEEARADMVTADDDGLSRDDGRDGRV
jgi:hypothetical protein